MVAFQARLSPPIPDEFNPVARILADAERTRKQLEFFVRHRDCRRILLALLNSDEPEQKRFAEEIRVALQSAAWALDAMRSSLQADFGGRRWFDDATK
jgi:hypothetical protein